MPNSKKNAAGDSQNQDLDVKVFKACVFLPLWYVISVDVVTVIISGCYSICLMQLDSRYSLTYEAISDCCQRLHEFFFNSCQSLIK